MAVAQAANDDNRPLAERIQTWPKVTKEYFDDLRAEMRRVTWPSRQQVQATTVVVIFTVFGFAAFFWIVDLLLSRGLNSIQAAFTK
jgi:preprotein translocase subunit SecE